eukprot:TRINITY_DN2100_c0_g1_i3.p1 TRINITY_DN2100_c0_g1~~TRINITY_DN2100_c0_g1_i3.p1  ORF type:complete len:515 (+),score=113.67 TRINITY_DN2100_c0_g1_i3:165-1709(+)
MEGRKSKFGNELEDEENETELTEVNINKPSGSKGPKSPRKYPTMSRTKTVARLETPTEAEVIQGVTGHQYSKEEHRILQIKDSYAFCVTLLIIQIFLAILYGIWVGYPESVEENERGIHVYRYARDVNVMIFFGFGFLMTFMRRYAYSAIGYTLLISALVAQWSVPLGGFFKTVAQDEVIFSTIPVGVLDMLDGLFCAGAVMISYGAILGKVTPSQMLILGFVEPIFYWLNLYVTLFLLKAIDVGGGMTIHTFGAYFGLSVCWFLTSHQTRTHKDNTSAYNSDIFSLAGTLFLWIMWPSFNAAIARPGHAETRAIVNTFISICSSTMATYLLSRLTGENKFDIVHIQNSTLAGGVIMGVAADLHVTPVGAIICGFVVGIISVLGYKYLTPFLSRKFNIQDICGINNLHGMPGICSCIVGIFVTLAAKNNKELYGDEYSDYFPQGDHQAGYQAAGLFITIGIAILGGSFTGLLMARGWRLGGLVKADFFNDRTFWHLPTDYEYVIDKDDAEENHQ